MGRGRVGFAAFSTSNMSFIMTFFYQGRRKHFYRVWVRGSDVSYGRSQIGDYYSCVFPHIKYRKKHMFFFPKRGDQRTHSPYLCDL